MKKTLLSLIATLAIGAAIAQPTFTAANLTPVAGERFFGVYADTTGVNLGASGASVTWDFSTLVSVDNDTISYMNCAATPFCDSISGASLASFDGNSYLYYRSTPTLFSVIGTIDTADTLVVRYDNYADMMYFPLSYLSTHADTFGFRMSFTGIDAFFTGTSNATCDAYGTIMLPDSVIYTNALRVHMTTLIKDSANFMGMPIVQEQAAENYSWYIAGFHNPVMTISYDTTGTGTPYISEVKYYTSTVVASGNATVPSAPGITVFPNPANNVINVGFYAADRRKASVNIMDMTGRVVATVAGADIKDGSNNIAVGVASLANGIYIIQVDNGVERTARKIVVSK